MANKVGKVWLGDWDKHIDNGGLSLAILYEDECVSIETEHSYCGLSHSSCLFCGTDVDSAELMKISQAFKLAAEKLALINA